MFEKHEEFESIRIAIERESFNNVKAIIYKASSLIQNLSRGNTHEGGFGDLSKVDKEFKKNLKELDKESIDYKRVEYIYKRFKEFAYLRFKNIT